MKNMLFILLLISFGCTAQTITPLQAKDYVGKSVTVCGKVDGTYTSKSGNIFINLGGNYPNQSFAVVIFSENAGLFDDDPASTYRGKSICGTGMVRLYKGKPEIIVSDPSQIK
jgi:DNA/RNA endonuclease YhcR with UshA esterase domain